MDCTQREKEYRERNADRVKELARERNKRYRAVHAEEVRARQREANRARYAAHRDEINAKVNEEMSQLGDMTDFAMPFDMSKMAYGGFLAEVEG